MANYIEFNGNVCHENLEQENTDIFGPDGEGITATITAKCITREQADEVEQGASQQQNQLNTTPKRRKSKVVSDLTKTPPNGGKKKIRHRLSPTSVKMVASKLRSQKRGSKN